MSKEGAPQDATLKVDGTGLRVAVIAGSWHPTVMTGLVTAAQYTIRSSGADHELITVAGSFEIPLAARVALENGFDAAVCLGVIVRGDTPHFDFVANSVTDGLTRVQLDTGKPVGFGILTVDNDAQALDRAGLENSPESKGQEAAEAALHLARVVEQLREN